MSWSFAFHAPGAAGEVNEEVRNEVQEECEEVQQVQQEEEVEEEVVIIPAESFDPRPHLKAARRRRVKNRVVITGNHVERRAEAVLDEDGADDDGADDDGADDHGVDEEVERRKDASDIVALPQFHYMHVAKPSKAQLAELGEVTAVTDVQASVYEGGLKLWECAVDLVEHFLLDSAQLRETLLPGARVLDLGCGHGLPGIFALTHGAAQVVFQDLNEEVLRLVTLPSVLWNHRGTKEEMLDPDTGLVRFVQGNWSDADMATCLLKEDTAGFDIIFTADTIYSPASLPVLVALLKKLVKPGTGKAFVAAKRYYFGVGGSTTEFMQLIQADESLAGEVVRVLQDGLSNTREIICVTRV